jgi:hypothetical protein
VKGEYDGRVLREREDDYFGEEAFEGAFWRAGGYFCGIFFCGILAGLSSLVFGVFG